MDENSIKPLDTGQRIRWKSRQRFIRKWMRRVVRNRLFLLTVLWVAKAIVKLAQIFGS
ncbi:hypothetical protein KXS07_33765 [Inquilinus limosus]|uniref:hypothetical protein n=1 Tax=Inquilinus limosus TaxID=171674 RepID=UPI003F149A41